MRTIGRVFIGMILVVITMVCGTQAVAASQVVLVNVKGEINEGQAALVKRAMEDAQNSGAQAFIMEIDTFGGLVDAGVKIRDIVSEAPVETVCYIKNRAWSAGALIAIAHKQIIIAPGGSIGAAEPIPATEKTIAALKAEFGATANKTGRNVRVAEAMVDKSLGFPGYAAPGQILALADYQAVQVGYADRIAADRAAVLAGLGLGDAEVREYSSNWRDNLTGWLGDATVKSILLAIIFLAILTEIKTAGTGIAGFIGLAAAALFFGGQWLSGFAGWMELVLFFSGLALLVFELYTPGTGLFGLAGIVCIMASLFLTLGADAAAVNILAVSLLIAVGVFLLIVRRLPSSKLWSKFVLKEAETSEAGFVSAQNYSSLLGKEGVAITSLRPAGIISIDGEQIDVVAEGRYIEKGTKVKVAGITGLRIVVRPVEE